MCIYIYTLRNKMCGYFMDGDYVDKKAKGTKECVIEQETKFEDCKAFLENYNTILKAQ